jgi:hypothetical protein
VTRLALLPICVAAASMTASCAGRQTPAAAQPDCSDPADCLCPWGSVLRLEDFEPLAEDSIPQRIVRCPQQGDCSWQVRDTADGVRIDHRRGGKTRLVAAVSDGSIVAHNRGELGASLFWVSRNGATHRLLGNPHVNDLITTKRGLLAATGLDHIIDGSGQLLLIARGANAEWRMTPFADVGAVAYAMTAAPDGSILVVTRTQLVKVTPAGVTTVLHTGRWDQTFVTGDDFGTRSGFNPRSVLLAASGDVYIGMMGVVAHLTPSTTGGYREQWLAPVSCAATTRQALSLGAETR